MSKTRYLVTVLVRGARGANWTLVGCKKANDAEGVKRARSNRLEAIRQARYLCSTLSTERKSCV